MNKTFDDFLKDQHAKNYTGTDDDMPDQFDHWVSELSSQEVIDYAEEFGKEVSKAGYDDGFEAGQASNLRSE